MGGRSRDRNKHCTTATWLNYVLMKHVCWPLLHFCWCVSPSTFPGWDYLLSESADRTFSEQSRCTYVLSCPARLLLPLPELLKWNMRAASVAFIVWTWDPHISRPPWSFKEAERGNLKLSKQSNQINLFGQNRDQATSKWMLSKKFPDRYKWGEFHCSIAHCTTINRLHSIMYNVTTKVAYCHMM